MFDLDSGQVAVPDRWRGTLGSVRFYARRVSESLPFQCAELAVRLICGGVTPAGIAGLIIGWHDNL